MKRDKDSLRDLAAVTRSYREFNDAKEGASSPPEGPTPEELDAAAYLAGMLDHRVWPEARLLERMVRRLRGLDADPENP